MTLGVSVSTVSRLQSNELDRFALLLTALGLKPVPVGHKCYSPEEIAALQLFARKGMAAHLEEGDSALHWE